MVFDEFVEPTKTPDPKPLSMRSKHRLTLRPDDVCEFFMGHGGSDKYGYSREVLNEDYAAKEIGKLWSYNKGGSREAYADLQAQVKELSEFKEKYEAVIQRILKGGESQ